MNPCFYWIDRPVSFRPGETIAAAPIEGFLHQRTELDTLGLDQPESACRAFGG